MMLNVHLLQKLKTRIIYKELNPVWDEDLTLSIENPEIPIELVRNSKEGYNVACFQLTCQFNVNI